MGTTGKSGHSWEPQALTEYLLCTRRGPGAGGSGTAQPWSLASVARRPAVCEGRTRLAQPSSCHRAPTRGWCGGQAGDRARPPGVSVTRSALGWPLGTPRAVTCRHPERSPDRVVTAQLQQDTLPAGGQGQPRVRGAEVTLRAGGWGRPKGGQTETKSCRKLPRLCMLCV